MYAKCGAFSKAQEVLKELPVQDVVMWNALIAAYAQQGEGEEALNCYDCMQRERQSPDGVTFTCVLKACGSIGATAKGEEIHKKIVSLGMLEKDIMLGNTLVDMYAKCGGLGKATQVLEELPARDVITWNALISGYAKQGQGVEALRCYDTMQCEGHSPDMVSFVCTLKACGSIGAGSKGEQIHEKIVISGMLDKDIVIGNALVDMYAKCGALCKARKVVEELPVQSVVTWNTLIAGYAQHGQGEEALKCYDSMQHEGHCPNVVTFICALKACKNIGSAVKGRQIHDKIVSLGMLEKEVVLGCTLVDMYAKCGALAKAQKVLKDIPVWARDVVTWSALISGYTQEGKGEEALKCFDNMQLEGHTPDVFTFSSALKACGSIGAVAKGKKIHDMIVSLGMLEKSIVLGNSLVDMYARCGVLADAQKLLEELPIRDVVMWSTLISGYVQQGQGEEALRCFDKMQHEGHSPDAVTFACALKACGCIGAAVKGEEIHQNIVCLGMMDKDMVLGSILVDMYARCGSPAKAQKVLEQIPVQDVIMWSALIGGYAQQGQSLDVFICFERMHSNGVDPNSTTFTCVLNACSHSGLLYPAEVIFQAMRAKYDIAPDEEHCCCMVDLYGRAGKFNKALEVIEKMQSAESFLLWVALLGASSRWGGVKIGRLAFERALYLDKSNVSIYVTMADIYIAAGLQEDLYEVELLRMKN